MFLPVASFVLASVLLVPALGAQLQPLNPDPWNPAIPPCLPFLPANAIDWPGGAFGDPAGFGRTLVAELDRDFAPEAIVACSGSVGVLWSAAALKAPKQLQIQEQPGLGSVADIALLPGEGPDGSDAFLVTDDEGLRKITFTPGIPGEFSTPGHFNGPVIANGNWIDAYPIRVEQLDGLGGLDVVGVAADHRTVVTLYRDNNGLGTGFVPGPTFTAPANVRDVAAVNWDGLGMRELVLLTIRGLVIHRLGTGSLIPPVMHQDATGCIARFDAPAALGGELLAWTRRKLSNPTESELKVLGSIGTALPPQLITFVTPCQDDKSVVPVALAAGDYDGASGDELLIAHELDHTMILLANKNESPWFDVTDDRRYDIAALSVSENVPLSCNVGMPAFAQLDGQTSEDIVIPVDFPVGAPVDARVLVFTELPHVRAYPEATTTTFFRSSDIVLGLTEYRPDYVMDSTPGSRLRFAFAIPGTPAYQNYTHLKMTVWHQDSPGDSHWVDEDARYHRYHPLVLPLNENNLEQWVELEYGFPEGPCWDPQEYFYTQFRFVKRNGQGVETGASPIFTGGLTMRVDPEVDQGYYEYLLQHGIPGTYFPLVENNNLDGNTEQNGTSFVGAYVPMSSHPPFEVNVTLSYPQLTVGGPTARVGEAPPPP